MGGGGPRDPFLSLTQVLFSRGFTHRYILRPMTARPSHPPPRRTGPRAVASTGRNLVRTKAQQTTKPIDLTTRDTFFPPCTPRFVRLLRVRNQTSAPLSCITRAEVRELALRKLATRPRRAFANLRAKMPLPRARSAHRHVERYALLTDSRCRRDDGCPLCAAEMQFRQRLDGLGQCRCSVREHGSSRHETALFAAACVVQVGLTSSASDIRTISFLPVAPPRPARPPQSIIAVSPGVTEKSAPAAVNTASRRYDSNASLLRKAGGG